MNTISHYKETRKEYNDIVLSLLSTLPDIFVVIRKLLPIPPIQKFCLIAHNTLEGEEMFSKLNSKLGKAWKIHRKHDLRSHPNLTYSYKDLIPSDSILLLSGGLDSFIQWRLLGQPKAIYFLVNRDDRFFGLFQPILFFFATRL